MLITAIRRTKGDLYSIYCGGESVALIDSKTLVEFERLEVGAELTEEEICEIQLESDKKQARDKALGVVARKETSRAALIAFLEKKEFPTEAAEFAADEMERLGFVDDRRCAEMLAGDIYACKHYSRRRCEWELCAKGIDREMAAEVAAELEPDPQETIYSLLKGKYAHYLTSDDGVRRCMNTLARLGFEGADIRAALIRLRDEDE